MSNPHAVTREFESELCRYTGAPYAVAVNSCTSALMLAVAWGMIMKARKNPKAWDRSPGPFCVEIPKRTYVGVPMAIIHAHGRPTFRDEEWIGAYQLKPLPVWDSARRFTGKLYECISECDAGATGQMVCVSFHWTKTLGVEYAQGGAILHDSAEADAWLRRARFDGRTEGVAPKDDTFNMVGWHVYMDPGTAGRLLKKMQFLPQHNAPLPWGPGTASDYPDLSKSEAFK